MLNYFDWLLEKVECAGDGFRATYAIMNNIPFRYYVLDDENRMCDGLDLRTTFLFEASSEDDITNVESPWPFDSDRASVFEVLVGIAIRMDYQGFDRTRADWMHMFLENLGINESNKQNSGYIHDVVNAFIEHRYAPNGKGGLFVCDTDKNMSRLSIFDQIVEFGNTVDIPNRWDD